MDRVECVVVGAGIVGLACARALALAGREVVILEAEGAIGMHTSSRNSEVIHAGIYYPAGSLKARSCVAGNRLLYEYCVERGVAHARCGKLIVAADASQAHELGKIQARAHANGATDVVRMTREQACALEPALSCTAALFSPSTGIIDSHALMLAYLGDAEARGAVLALRSRLERALARAGGFELRVAGAEPIECRILVNSAGLRSPGVARAIDGYPVAMAPRELYAKGNYYTLAGRAPFSRLVYPVPEPGGLGVHVTLDLAGRVRFGPDVEWVDAIDYQVDPRRAERFYGAIRRYWPALPDGALAPAYAGIRPKTAGQDEPAQDFLVQGPREHGVPGLANLFGIESPGLTASLALADHVATLLNNP
ncbi:MAG: FAD-dependent oxidoreductase [Betaproteobacteria bacterium RIFCSPHIGHO2_12_FULL_69_13]|nr:MAG: FAD-dependent oxidoreductase [Betaproteobacteria bacterium RIFCSPHIGHO2_12_FULL_69_13]OGA64654.1 MAG: FAD-dependent oxidoreductase [Betaproteobacteria bacterium RIFCSPLOWO2_12_FULL_68_20]